jgi:hypothetical protein
MALSLERRVEALEAALGGDGATLEELVLWSTRQGPCDDETERRLETSRLGRLVVAAAAIPAPAVPPQQAFSLARAVAESCGAAAAPAAPPPVHETGLDLFYQRGEVFDSGYDDGDLVPAQPGLSLAALMAGHRRNGKHR